MKRSKHNLSHYRMVTGGMGELLPIACVPVLPGDTFQHSASALIRVAPLNTPVMHPVSVRVHHFFVPNRITWPESESGGWEQFITGGPDGNNSASIPTTTQTNDKKSLLSYLGVPPINGAIVNSLALRAANMCVNEYYRDQDIVAERTLEDNSLPVIAWEKDYFSTARPWAQKGPQVTLPIGDKAIVRADTDLTTTALTARKQDGSDRQLDTSLSTLSFGSGSTGEQLYADLASSTQVNINDFRTGFAIQRYQEARARYGSRFTEYLRYLNIQPSDARLQRPEYLGGGTTRLNFSEVLQTTPSTNPGVEAGVGDLYGHGIAGVRSNAYRKFFEEHGYVISFLSVRPKAIYMNGVDREWNKTTKEDFYQRELVNLGQQEVQSSELYANNTPTVFGYQDRYDEYRRMNSQVSQDFRDLLNSWHLARELQSDVALNEDFISCKPSDRIFQVTTTDSLWVMVNHRLVARRLLPKRAQPRVV